MNSQGDKCKICNYSCHFKCSLKAGKTCLSPTAMDVWGKRDVIDISVVLFSKEVSFLSFLSYLSPFSPFLFPL